MAAPKPKPTFNFFLSCDINLQVKVRVASLHGQLPSFRSAYPHTAPQDVRPTALYVVARLEAGGEVLGLETKTTYSHSTAAGCSWNEWLTFCIKYRDLPPDAALSLSIWELAEGRSLELVGDAAMQLFNKKGRLKTGRQQLKVHEKQAATSTSLDNGILDSSSAAKALGNKLPLPQRSQVQQLEHLAKLYERGDVPRVGWLDKLAFEEIGRLQDVALAQASGRPELQLVLDLPSFPHAVLYQQGAAAQPAAALGTAAPGGPAAVAAKKEAAAAAAGMEGANMREGLILLKDTEVGRDNPAELKAEKLMRSLTRGVIDRDLKPNSEERKRIQAVLRLPPNRPLQAAEKMLLWRFRFSLLGDKRALTKFLKSVDWGDAQEAKQAIDLMQQWVPIDVADALELLSPDFKNEEVRRHAVSVLQRHDDDELLYYLLQLVQALRFEATDLSKLAGFLISRGAANPVFATFLHWYLFTEWEDPTFGSRASAVHGAFVNALTQARQGDRVWEAIRRQTDMMTQLAYIIKDLKASRLKAARATERMREMLSETGPCSELTQQRVPLPLNPHIMLEGLVPSECGVFKSAQLPIRLSYRVSPHPIDWEQQQPLASVLHGVDGAGGGDDAVASSRQGSGALVGVDGTAGLQGGRSGSSTGAGELGRGHGHVGGGVALGEEAGGAPPVLAQRTALVQRSGHLRCVLIYKKGDDLRQDQFILQMISLMDSLLKRESLDLRLTPYRVLPTSADDGLVEFVPSAPLSTVIAEHRTIHKFLMLSQADPTGPFGLRAEVVETFVRSCAGYCVATYILGVGDRHLDNLMLAPDGRLFHIDFAYILGNDPKPFPPPMKLCREMIEGMGGQDNPYYVQFRMFSCEAYNILRKSADLILSLFHLMAGASIEAIRANPENAMLKLQEKLRLDLDDEQAVEWMQGLINESATALMPQLVEATHRWAQALK